MALPPLDQSPPTPAYSWPCFENGDVCVLIVETERPWWSRWLLGRIKTTVIVP